MLQQMTFVDGAEVATFAMVELSSVFAHVCVQVAWEQQNVKTVIVSLIFSFSDLYK